MLVLVVGGCCLAAGAQAMPAVYYPPPCPRLTFHTQPTFHAAGVCMNVGKTSHGTTLGSYLFLTPGVTGAGIYTDGGTLVWWLPQASGAANTYDLTVVHLWGRRYLAVWSGSWTHRGYDNGSVTLYNEHYQRVGVITAGRPFAPDRVDLHDFRITPQGDGLIGIWAPVRMKVRGRLQTVIQYVVQKLSLVRGPTGIHTGRVLFHWNSLRDVPVSESHQANSRSFPWDYFHGNTVVQDTDGNLIVSSRNTWGIYKISVRTGHVMWEVGARGDHALKRPWCYQHDVTPLGNNRYSVFDDGGGGAGCAPGAGAHASRALVFQVIPSGRRPRVKLIHAYRHAPPTDSAYLGSTQLLPHGHVLVDWGWTPELTEYSTRHPTVNLDLSMTRASYRALSFQWDGEPAAPPAVAASSTAHATTVWASWNGSTEVTAWRVLAGPTAPQIVPIGPAHQKRGFETAIHLTETYGAVAVQALGAGGQLLASSRPIAPSTG